MAHYAALQGRNFTREPEDKLTISGTQDRSTQLPKGLYLLYADTDVYFLQGGSGVTAASTSIPLPSGTYLEVEVRGAGTDYISAIQQSAGGSLWIISLGA